MSEREELKFFSVAEIGRILGISNSKAYEIMVMDNFHSTLAK